MKKQLLILLFTKYITNIKIYIVKTLKEPKQMFTQSTFKLFPISNTNQYINLISFYLIWSILFQI